MGLADMFSKEDRVDVTFSTFYQLIKGCTERDLLANGIKCNVPHRYMREIVTGNSEEPESYLKLEGEEMEN